MYLKLNSMKKSIIFNIVLLLVSLAAFSQKTPKMAIKNTSTEDFSIFQSRFFSDDSFQLIRITFPVPFVEPDNPPYMITKEHWEFNSHLYWNKANPADIHFKLIDVVDENNSKVVHSRLDSGNYENYTFSLVDGKWFLVKVEITNL